MKINYFLLIFFSLSLSAQTTLIGTTVPDLTAYGETNYVGQAQYDIFLSGDGVLDKPIIVVDGFDPGDTRSITGLYDLLSYEATSGTENLADFVRGEGFDVVILNFPIYTRPDDMALIDGGADFIERNAMLLVDLINIINTDKVGNEQNVIIGPSMGGLISRFALGYMEQQTLDHDTRLWLSFDAPHHGANVPIGLQHQLNVVAFGLQTTLAGDNSVVELQPLISSFLRSPAAKQLLVDHLDAHLANGSTVDFDPSIVLPVADPFRAIFDSNINNLTSTGYPENTRNVAIINGSGIGSAYQDINGADISPGFALISETINVAPFTDLVSGVNFTPTSTNNQQVSFIDITFFGGSILVGGPKSANSEAPSFTDGVDAAPGGLFDIGSLTDGVDTSGLAGQFLGALNSDAFSFIPSVSGMALDITSNGEIDWYHDFDLPGGTPPEGDVLNSTPFINYYIPDDNEPHVQLTEANVAFALTEILAETLSVNQFEDNDIRLESNPISSELTILSDNPINDAFLQLFDLTGKTVYSNNFDISSRTSISLNIQSGIYLLNITNSQGLSFKTKVAVR